MIVNKLADINRLAPVQPTIQGQKSSGAFLDVLSQSWHRADSAMQAKINKLPSEVKGLFELQRTCANIQLQVECVTKVADSAATTVKKVQQLGGQ